MNYVVSDIHGCLDEFKKLLEKINFSDDDMLYCLGDVVDRGPKPIATLQYLMSMPNVEFIIGNHEYIAYSILKKLTVEITEDNAENYLCAEDLLKLNGWIQNGGETTIQQFRALDKQEKRDILEYIEDALAYEEVFIGDKRFVLTHSGIAEFDENKELDEYPLYAFIDDRIDYSRRYFEDEDTYLVTGHTPTMLIRADKEALIYEGNGHIAIDCGCAFGGRLAAYCLETSEVTYVDGPRK